MYADKSLQLLSRFRDRATAKNLEKILREALATVGLEIGDISGMTTDSATVMLKLGRLLKKAVTPKPFFHQRCFAHALHLAVTDTFKDEESPFDWHIVGVSDPERKFL